MDESNTNKASPEKKSEDSAPSSDWELLSMSMTASVSDLKSALAAAEEEGGESGGVSEAAMHSQYFGQVMASVLPPAPSGEIFAQEEGELLAGKLSDPQEAKVNQPPIDAGEAEDELRRKIEQQILAAALGEEGGKFPEAASAVGVEFPVRSCAEVVEVVKEEGLVKAEVMVAAVVSSSPRKKSKVRSSEGMMRRLQLITKKVNKSSTVWSIALVAAVTGLLIVGKRWYDDSFKSLESLSLDSYTTDEKLSDIAREIAEGNHAADAAAAAAASEAVEAQASNGGLLGALRDFW